MYALADLERALEPSVRPSKLPIVFSVPAFKQLLEGITVKMLTRWLEP
jgi:hypothetical protein